MDRKKFIEWREKHKEKISTIILLSCVAVLVFEFHFKLVPAIEEINQEYNQDTIDMIEELNSKNNNLLIEQPFNNNIFTENNLEINDDGYVELEHSPIVEAVYALLNIIFSLWIISLLWKSPN